MSRLTLGLTILFGLSALTFYIAERAFILFRWSRLEELDVPRSRRQRVEKCLEERELVISSLLVIGTLFLAAMAAILYAAAPEWPQKVAVGGIVLTILWLVPEAAAWRLSDFISIRLVPPLYLLVGKPFRAIRAQFIATSHAAQGESAPAGGEAQESADAGARELFRMAVRLRHKQVREIMTPRPDMVSVADTATLQQAAQVCLQSGYSRIPVHRGNRDQIIGVLHAKDLLQYAATDKWHQSALMEIVRPPFFVPETRTVSKLMEDLQRTSIHMGIVLDEYGGTSGLVTLEDVVEELLGDIHDEHESASEEPPLYKWTDPKTVEVRAVMRIEEFNEEFNFDLPEEEEFDTLGGLAMYLMGKIPAKGESFRVRGARVTVLDADARHVIRVAVAFDEEPPAGERA